MPPSWIVVAGLVVHGFAWEYSGNEGPSHWSKKYPDCGGNSQSPINIKPAEASHSAEKLNFEVDRALEAEYRLENFVHTAKVIIRRTNVVGEREPTEKYKVKFQGQTYAALQYHFHWGSTDKEGSEHIINGKPFSGEMHAVHWNVKYNSDDMFNHKDGALVVGTFVEVGAENHALKHVTDKLKDITKPKGKTSYSNMDFSIRDLLSVSIETHFFHYNGSLTTPPCSETVSWVVGKDVIEMSSGQLAAFRKLQYKSESEGKVVNISENFRPVQKLNSRRVFKSFESASTITMLSFSPVPIAMIAIKQLL